MILVSMFQVRKQKYHISMNSNQVYDISERKVLIWAPNYLGVGVIEGGYPCSLVGDGMLDLTKQ